MAEGEGFQVPPGEIVLETSLDFDGVDEDLDELAKKGEGWGKRT